MFSERWRRGRGNEARLRISSHNRELLGVIRCGALSSPDAIGLDLLSKMMAVSRRVCAGVNVDCSVLPELSVTDTIAL